MLVMNHVYKIITFVIIPLDRFPLLCRSGKITCKNRSVISSSSLFPFIQEFDINDFNPILSDIHNSIHISLKTCLQKQNTKHTTATQQTKSVKRNDNKRDDFVNMVISDRIGFKSFISNSCIKGNKLEDEITLLFLQVIFPIPLSNPTLEFAMYKFSFFKNV
jgi:hypothetical protein